MDNFNALSKSAILTKLALDGYFIDLLTLNSFIKDWQIEAIYENEFGIEFFDNNSYLTILDNLKDKYNKAKAGNEEQKPKTEPLKTQELKEPAKAIDAVSEDLSSKKEDMDAKDAEIVLDEIVIEDNAVQKEPEVNSVPVSEVNPAQTESLSLINEESEILNPEYKTETSVDNNIIELDSEAVSLEELAFESKREIENENKTAHIEDGASSVLKPEIIEHYEDAILPMAMRNLKPGPVTPTSNINVDHSYDETIEILHYEGNKESAGAIDDKNLDGFEQESFSPDEIEKANNLINNAGKTVSQKLPESITETYFDTSKPTAGKKEPAAMKETQNAEQEENIDNKAEELDLVQLAQSFAQNFTGKETGDVPPADLEQIFTESYTEPFSELQDYVKDGPEEYKSLQEDFPSDIAAPQMPKEATHSDRALVSSHSGSDLNAEDVRNIIREEIARQTASIVPVPQNNENVKEILREIVKQTADVVPQNAFKLDISQGTLDMIAKTIAKKIAIKLNSYYKLNSSKQNAKLQLFRTRTIELKEKNQMLADENRRLKARLLESNSELNSYKRTVFGLYKFEGRKRR